MLTLTSREQRNGYANPLTIQRYHINIAINNQLTTTKINQILTNPNDFTVDGIYIFPVPDDAAISNLALSVDGDPVTGRLLSHNESRRVYRTSVREGHNLGLTDQFGTRAFVADVRTIPARSERNIEFEYSQILPVENDLAKYSHPLSLAKSANSPIENLAINIEIESEKEIRTINSVSHEIKIDRKNDNHVKIGYEGIGIEPDDDFQLHYSISEDDFGITLLTHRADENEDGYFMLLISPKYEVENKDVMKKDFIFVLDHSGSMAGKKVSQAKEALRYCVNNLNEGDRFNLILFNTGITSFADRLNRSNERVDGELAPNSAALSRRLIDAVDGRKKAIAFIEDIEGQGGTNINDALLTALSEEPDPNRPRIIVFLTDGCPTVGVTNETQILKNVKEANRNQSKIFVFGVGYDLNVRLLDKLAVDNGGSRNYVEPHEDIEEAVSSLFRKMNEPVLVNIDLDFGQIITQELTPMNLPDLFRGEQTMVLGRYENHAETVIKLRGAIGSEEQEISKQVCFAKLQTDNDHLAQLWAQRRVAELADQAALIGDRNSKELLIEIERISKKYDVITPDTSFEMADDGSYRRSYKSATHIAYDRSIPIEDRVRRSKEMERRKNARSKLQDNDTKYFGNKTFYRHDGMWVDTKYDGQSERKTIEIGTDEYFDLSRQSYELGKCLKLYPPMIICHDGVNYEIIPRRS